MKIIGKYINGEYLVTLLSDGTKIRETDDDKDFIPAFAENCDCKITSCCDGGCPWCYEGCTPDGKHGDILNYEFLDTLHPYTELAINGNDLSHPDLIPFLEKIKSKKVICNMTVAQKHFEKHFDFIKELVDKELIVGLGVSLSHATEAFVEKIKQFPNAVIHVINGIFGAADYSVLKDNNLKLLILGYKMLRRGVDWYEKDCTDILQKQKWLYNTLEESVKRFNVVSFDNLAIEQLDVKRLMSQEEWDEFYMGDDMEFTFFLDLVEGKFAGNSIAPEEARYPIMNNIDDMFNKIRKGKREIN